MHSRTPPVVLTALLAIPVFTLGQNEPNTKAPSLTAWRDDIDAIVHDLRAIHPAPFAVIGELPFLRQVEALKKAL